MLLSICIYICLTAKWYRCDMPTKQLSIQICIDTSLLIKETRLIPAIMKIGISDAVAKSLRAGLWIGQSVFDSRPAAMTNGLRAGLYIGRSGFDSRHTLTAWWPSNGKGVKYVFVHVIQCRGSARFVQLTWLSIRIIYSSTSVYLRKLKPFRQSVRELFICCTMR